MAMQGLHARPPLRTATGIAFLLAAAIARGGSWSGANDESSAFINPDGSTRELAPLKGVMGACGDVPEFPDCMREFDSCWTDGINSMCNAPQLGRWNRHKSKCFNQVFWHCLGQFAQRDGVDVADIARRRPLKLLPPPSTAQ